MARLQIAQSIKDKLPTVMNKTTTPIDAGIPFTPAPTNAPTPVTIPTRMTVTPPPAQAQQSLNFENELKYLTDLYEKGSEGQRIWAENQAKTYGEYFKSMFDVLKTAIPTPATSNGGGGNVQMPNSSVGGSQTSTNVITGNLGSIMFIGVGMMVLTAFLGIFKR